MAKKNARIGGAETTPARAEAARLNGQLGGRPRTLKPLTSQEQKLQTVALDAMRAITERLRRSRQLGITLRIFLACDSEALDRKERAALMRAQKLMSLVSRRAEKERLALAAANRSAL